MTMIFHSDAGGECMSSDTLVLITVLIGCVILLPVLIGIVYLAFRYVALIVGVIWTAIKSLHDDE